MVQLWLGRDGCRGGIRHASQCEPEEVLSQEISELEAEVAKLTADAESATAQRKKENGDYKVAHQDLSESVDAIARAIQTLKKREGDVPQSLLQVSGLVIFGIILEFVGSFMGEMC